MTGNLDPPTGAPGGSPVSNAPVAAGVFPIYNFTHGYGSSPHMQTVAWSKSSTATHRRSRTRTS